MDACIGYLQSRVAACMLTTYSPDCRCTCHSTLQAVPDSACCARDLAGTSAYLDELQLQKLLHFVVANNPEEGGDDVCG